jgi:hypothetical protein
MRWPGRRRGQTRLRRTRAGRGRAAGDVIYRRAEAQKYRQPNQIDHDNDPRVIEATHHKGDEAVSGQARNQRPNDRGNPTHARGPCSGNTHHGGELPPVWTGTCSERVFSSEDRTPGEACGQIALMALSDGRRGRGRPAAGASPRPLLPCESGMVPSANANHAHRPQGASSVFFNDRFWVSWHHARRFHPCFYLVL